MMEDKPNKRKISDALRLESIKRRKSEKAAQVKLISTALNNVDSSDRKNKKIVFDSGSDDESQTAAIKTSRNAVDGKVPLFNFCDSEDDDEDYGQQIKSKTQFEGERGAQLFQKNLECTDERFKLDERFQENDDGSSYFASNQQEVSLEDVDETELEKDKNLEILEKVLGTKIRKPHLNEVMKSKKKTYVRYDPESENAANYIRKQDPKPKQEKKSDEEDTVISKEPVVSKARFFEVATNLKDLLSTSGERLNLGNKFKLFGDIEEQPSPPSRSPKKQDASSLDTSFNNSLQHVHKIDLFHKGDKSQETNTSTSDGHVKPRTFFMQPDDDRLKEGINFFQRTESLDTVREQWPVIRNVLIEAYKNNRKMGLRSSKPRSKHFQNQKRNFK